MFEVPSMVQWVKNLTEVPWVSVAVEVQSPAWHSQLQDLALLHLWWPGNFHVLWIQPLKKKISYCKVPTWPQIQYQKRKYLCFKEREENYYKRKSFWLSQKSLSVPETTGMEVWRHFILSCHLCWFSQALRIPPTLFISNIQWFS